MVDFTSILSKPAIEAEKPQPAPSGSYQAAIQGMPKQREVKTKEGDRAVLSFSFKAVAPMAIDNQEYFDSYPTPINEWFPLPHDIFIEGEQGEWNLRQFLENALGIDPGDSSNPKTFGEMIAESPGRMALITIAHEPYMDKANQPQIAVRIRGVAAI